MNGSRIKKISATFFALTLCGAVLSQAAGPREFLFGIWDKRPRVSESRLNPKTWQKSRANEVDVTRRVRLDPTSSVRETLHNDPFRFENSGRLRELVSASPPDDSNRRLKTQSQLNGERFGRAPSSAPRNIDGASRPVGPGSFDLDHRESDQQVSQSLPENIGQPSGNVEERDFSPAFEAMVQQVLADRRNGASGQTSRNSPQLSLPPSAFERTGRDVSRDGLSESGTSPRGLFEEESQLDKSETDNQAVRDRKLVLDPPKSGGAEFEDSAVEAPQPIMQINPGPLPGTAHLVRSNSTIQPRSRDADSPSPQFPNESSQQGVQDLIDSSRRELRTDISPRDNPSNLQPVAQIQRATNDNRLRLLGQEPPLVLSPQLPRESHRYADPSQDAPGTSFQPSQDFDKDWNRSRIEFDQAEAKTGGRNGSQSGVSDYQPMIITPRVTANQAPRLSVPNNAQYRRLSYEESASESPTNAANHAQRNDDQPLLMIPNGQQKDGLANRANERAAVVDERPQAASQSTESNSSGTLGPVNWGDATDAVAVASSGLPWLMMAIIAVCSTAIISFLIVRTRKVVMVTSRATNATNEAD